jgi:hypothetical protein
MGPEPVEIGAQRFQPGGVYGVNATSAFGSVGDKTGALEHPQVLRDRRAADWKVASQLAHGAWIGHEPLKDGATGAIAQGIPWIHSVSHH